MLALYDSMEAAAETISAIIAARSRIVEGAVGMVHMALEKLGERGMAIPIKVWPIQIVLPWMFLSSALRHLAFGVWPALRPAAKEEDF